MRQTSWGPGSTSLGAEAQEFPGVPELLLLSPEAQEIPEDSELVLLSQAAQEIPDVLDKGFVDQTKLIRNFTLLRPIVLCSCKIIWRSNVVIKMNTIMKIEYNFEHLQFPCLEHRRAPLPEGSEQVRGGPGTNLCSRFGSSTPAGGACGGPAGGPRA